MKYAIDSGPHIKTDYNIDSVYKRLLIALIPIVLFSIYKNVFLVLIENKYPLIEVIHPLLIIFVSVFAAILSEKIYTKIDSFRNGYRRINPFYAGITGLYVALILPINIPLYIPIIGSCLGILLGKMLYGGFGKNLFNPTAIAYIFLLLIFSTTLSNYGNYFNLIEKEQYLTLPINNLTSFDYDKLITPFGSLVNFLFGTVPGAIGTTNSFLILLSFLLMSLLKVIKWKITIVYIATVFVMTYIIGDANGATIWYPVFNILNGSLLFAAVFMNDPVTTSSTNTGQILNGIILGISTVLVRFLSMNPERILVAIIISNIFVPYLDILGAYARKNKIFKYLILLISVLAVIIISYAISNYI